MPGPGRGTPEGAQARRLALATATAASPSGASGASAPGAGLGLHMVYPLPEPQCDDPGYPVAGIAACIYHLVQESPRIRSLMRIGVNRGWMSRAPTQEELAAENERLLRMLRRISDRPLFWPRSASR